MQSRLEARAGVGEAAGLAQAAGVGEVGDFEQAGAVGAGEVEGGGEVEQGVGGAVALAGDALAPDDDDLARRRAGVSASGVATFSAPPTALASSARKWAASPGA